MALLYLSIARYKQAGSPRESTWHTLENSKVFGVVSWLISLAVLGFVTLYPLPANESPMKWSRFHNSIFISLSRPAFMLSLILLMVCMLLNHGRTAKRALGVSALLPLSRLTYSVYLVLPLVSTALISSMQTSLYLSYSAMFYLLAYNFLACFAVALFVWVFIESPLQYLAFSCCSRRGEA